MGWQRWPKLHPNKKPLPPKELGYWAWLEPVWGGQLFIISSTHCSLFYRFWGWWTINQAGKSQLQFHFWLKSPNIKQKTKINTNKITHCLNRGSWIIPSFHEGTEHIGISRLPCCGFALSFKLARLAPCREKKHVKLGSCLLIAMCSDSKLLLLNGMPQANQPNWANPPWRETKNPGEGLI